MLYLSFHMDDIQILAVAIYGLSCINPANLTSPKALTALTQSHYVARHVSSRHSYRFSPDRMASSVRPSLLTAHSWWLAW